MRIEEAADRVKSVTALSVAVFTAPKSLSVNVFPPKTNTKITNKSIKVRGIARRGEANHKRISSKAAIPRTTYAQVGIEVEYVSFSITIWLHFFLELIIKS